MIAPSAGECWHVAPDRRGPVLAHLVRHRRVLRTTGPRSATSPGGRPARRRFPRAPSRRSGCRRRGRTPAATSVRFGGPAISSPLARRAQERQPRPASGRRTAVANSAERPTSRPCGRPRLLRGRRGATDQSIGWRAMAGGSRPASNQPTSRRSPPAGRTPRHRPPRARRRRLARRWTGRSIQTRDLLGLGGGRRTAHPATAIFVVLGCRLDRELRAAR